MGVSAHQPFSNGNGEECNDLIMIRGIGATKKRWLEALGICTIADLAHASVDEIESQFKDSGRTVPRNEIEGWITQAQALQAEVSLQPTQSSSTEPEDEEECAICFSGSCESTQQPAELVEAIVEEVATPWSAIASFAIEYQTRQVAERTEWRTVIRHMETDTVETWADTETELIQPWMRDRIKAALPQTEAEPAIVPEITQLRMIQPDQIGQPMIADPTRPFFPDAVRRGEPFAMEVSMQLAGLTATTLIKQVAYRAQCVARNLSTGATVQLGDVTANVPLNNRSSCKALFPEVTLQQPGIYRLKVSVTLQDASDTAGYFKVPMLQVV